MENKVIYRNKQNGKIGTLVQKNEKFRQYILEVEGKNVPYSSATIKRWWEVIDEKEVAVATDHTEEITSVSEPEAESTPLAVSKPDVKDELPSKEAVAKTKPKKQPKKTSKSSKVTGPDMEVFSYIQKQALDAGYTQLPNHMGARWMFFGKPRQNGKVRAVIHFYIAREFIRVRVKYDKVVDNKELMKDKNLDFSNIDFFLDADFKFDISLYKEYADKFLALN